MPRAVFAQVLLWPALALAKMDGIDTTNCFGCHGANLPAPAVTLTGPAQSIAAGSTVLFMVTVAGPISNGGFFLTSNQAGTFTAISGTRLWPDGIGHSMPGAAAQGTVSWKIPWTAPATPGGTELTLAVNGGNGDSHPTGDRPGNARLSIAWGCAPVTYYSDADGDGHADPSTGPFLRCGPEPGLSALGDDCDDADPLVFPGAVEACNGRDDNCNGQIDEGLSTTMTWPNLDGDGYGDAHGVSQLGCATSARAANDLDCDDTDAKVFPGAPEICDLKDNDCDGQVDEDVRVTCGTGWCGRFGPSCDPAQCVPGPPMAEACNNFDDDCDGVVDNGDLCGPAAVCFEGKCYFVDESAPDAGPGDAGSPAPDSGVTPDAGGLVHDPPPPGGCRTAPSHGVALALALAGLSRRRRSTIAGAA